MINLIPLACTLLACFGLAYAVGHSRITLRVRGWIAPPRGWDGLDSEVPVVHYEAATKLEIERLLRKHYPANWARQFIVDLLECPFCFGFWEGVVLGLAWPGALPIAWGVPYVLVPIVTGLLVGAVNLYLGFHTGIVGDQTDTTSAKQHELVEAFKAMSETIQARAEAPPSTLAGLIGNVIGEVAAAGGRAPLGGFAETDQGQMRLPTPLAPYLVAALSTPPVERSSQEKTIIGLVLGSEPPPDVTSTIIKALSGVTLKTN